MSVLGDGMLERLHDVREALVAVEVGIHLADFGDERGDGQEGGTFEEDDFFRFDELAEDFEELLDAGKVGNELVNDSSPGFVQGLVPNAAGEGVDFEALRATANQGRAFIVETTTVLGLYEVHLVNEDEDVCSLAVLLESLDNRVVGFEIAIDVTRFDIEDVDED